MKKLLIVSSIVASLAATQASAKEGFYVGADINSNNVSQKYQDRGNHTNSGNGVKADNDAIGFGVNAGYKISFDKAFVAPEAFYDYLNNSHPAAGYDRDMIGRRVTSFEVNHRFGAKINLGYDVTPEFSPFVSLGMAAFSYEDNDFSRTTDYRNYNQKAWQTAPIYGLGFTYNINDNVGLRLSVDRQKTNLGGAFNYDRITTVITTSRLGVVYSF